MFAVFVNVATVLVGSILGLLLKDRFSQRTGEAVLKCLGLCTIGIGMGNLLNGADTLGIIICMVVGTLIGEGLDIERKMDGLGELLKRKFVRGDAGSSRFVEGFVNATVLFCVGAMSINGAIAAGLSGDYSILISKSVMDGVSSITFAAAMGVGVPFAALVILIYEGGMTLLAGVVGPYLGAEVITMMSAVGGVIIVGIGLNMAASLKDHIRVSNMLPAIFLPIVYMPLVEVISNLIG